MTKKGPITFGMLQQRFNEALPESTLVWTEGMEQWTLASSVPGLTTDTMTNNPHLQPSTTVVERMQATVRSLEPPAQPIKLDVGFRIGQARKFASANSGQIFLLCLYFLCFRIMIAGILAILVGLLSALPTVLLAGLIAFRYLHCETSSIGVRP